MQPPLKGDEYFNVTGTISGQPAAITRQITIDNLLQLIAGGPPRPILSGTVDTVDVSNDSFIEWLSADAAPKTELLGPGNFPGQEIGICDGLGTASAEAITLQAVGPCTIGGNASLPLSDDFFTIVLKWDGSSNWIIVSYYDGSKSAGPNNFLLSDDGQVLTDDQGNPLIAG